MLEDSGANNTSIPHGSRNHNLSLENMILSRARTFFSTMTIIKPEVCFDGFHDYNFEGESTEMLPLNFSTSPSYLPWMINNRG